MTIHLPADLETSIEAAVRSGRFASVDDAMAEAARLLVRTIKQEPSAPNPNAGLPPLLGSMRDAADELDEIVAEAMKRRREEPWRTIPGELNVSDDVQREFLHCLFTRSTCRPVLRRQ